MKSAIKKFLIYNVSVLPLLFLSTLFILMIVFISSREVENINKIQDRRIKEQEIKINDLEERVKANSITASKAKNDLSELKIGMVEDEFFKNNNRTYKYPGTKNISYLFSYCCTGTKDGYTYDLGYDLYIEYEVDKRDDLGTSTIVHFDSNDIIQNISVEEMYYLGIDRPFLYISVDSAQRYVETLLMPYNYSASYKEDYTIVHHQRAYDVQQDGLNYYIKSITEEEDKLIISVERYDKTDKLVDTPKYIVSKGEDNHPYNILTEGVEYFPPKN